MRILFAGTPDFSVSSLRALLATKHTVAAVFTQPDRAAGRGRGMKASPVKEVAMECKLPLYQPKTLRDSAIITTIRGLQADLMVVVAYGLLLPREVLAAPKYGCINIHASLLPRWRGAAPIQRCLLAGDQETGITVMQMDEGLDTGDILGLHACPIQPHDTSGDLHDRLAALGAQALTEHLAILPQGGAKPKAQDAALACYAAKIEKSEGLLDWKLASLVLERKIRAFHPWPVAWTFLHGKPLRIHAAESMALTADQATQPGTVLACEKTGIDVVTGAGMIRLLAVQMAGKRRMHVREFVKAHSLADVVLGAE